MGDPLKSFSISQFRDFAGIPRESQGSAGSTIGRIDNRQDRQSATDPGDKRYYIDVPTYWTKEDLLDLKDYLGTLEVGLIPVWIRVHGIEKNTKFTISDITRLEEWVKKRS
jgi:hypothetical protein